MGGNSDPGIRFWSRVQKQPEGCWQWTDFTTRKGYGLFNAGQGHTAWAHRYAYQLVIGPIPEGLVLDHLCRNRACVNPAHLEPVTIQENIRRGDAGRDHREKTHCPKGHPYSGENLYLAPRGRECRICRRQWNRDRRAMLATALS